MIDHAKIRRESLRWYVLLTLHNASPVGCSEQLLFQTLSAIYGDVTSLEVRNQLDYLESRELLRIEGRDSGSWHGKLIRYGTDIVEYTIPCEPGIARPVKNWG